MKYLIMLVLISPLMIVGQNFTIPLWENGIPNFKTTVDSEIKDKLDGEYYRIVREPAISVYLPSKHNITGEAVLVIPGGGYHKLSYVWEGIDVAKWLNANGVVAIVLKHRLPTDLENNIVRDKSPMLDASRAMRIIRANAEKWNIDKNKIGVIGFSAGGHLASTLGTHYNQAGVEKYDEIDSGSSRPDFLALIYPVISMSAEFGHTGSKKNLLGKNPSEELIEYYSNEKHVTSDTPPTFLLHSSDDNVVSVKNSIKFYEALQENKVKAELHIYPYGGHGFSLANGKGYLSTWKNRFIDWLRDIE